MAPILFLLFIIMPIIEISVLIQVGEQLGGFATISLVILTALVGASLVKNEGIKVLFEVRQKMASGELPAKQMLSGLLIAISGVLLITPGFITDFIGLLFVTPLSRNAIVDYLSKRIKVVSPMQQPFNPHDFSQQNDFHSNEINQNPFKHSGDKQSKSGNTIDGEFERKDDK